MLNSFRFKKIRSNILLIVLGVFISAACFAKKTKQTTVEKLVKEDLWILGEMPKPVLKVIRAREKFVNLSTISNLGDYPFYVRLSWKYGLNRGIKGMPNHADIKTYTEFEKKMLPKFSKTKKSVLLVIMTSAGSRNWYLQAKNENEFQNILAANSFALKTKLNVKIHRDPKWQRVWDKFYSKMPQSK